MDDAEGFLKNSLMSDLTNREVNMEKNPPDSSIPFILNG